VIVDSHVHVISDDLQRYPLKPSGTATWHNECRVTTEQFLEQMDEAGVDQAILVQGTGAYSDDNSYTVDSAVKYPERFASVGVVDSRMADAPSQLTRWVRDRKMQGLRIFAASSSDGAGLNEEDYPLWETAQNLGIPVIAFMRPPSLPKLKRVLQRYPNVQFALDHIALVPLDKGPSDESVRTLFDMASLPNLYLKFSSRILDPIVAGGLDFREAVRQLAEQFGAHRLIWGSDYTATHHLSYKGLVEHGKESVSLLTPEQQAWVLGGTALSLWPHLKTSAK